MLPALALRQLPLVAILRGLCPSGAAAVGTALVDAGFTAIEVPLNGPRPLACVAALVAAVGERAAIGAGTLRRPGQARATAAAGGRFVVSPHTDTGLIQAARQAGLYVMPGVMTPTEAFAAIDAGADALKLFPAEACTPRVVRALRAVLPPDIGIFPVGGISPDSMMAWREAGATGFGLGSALYRPGRPVADVAARAAAFVAAWRSLSGSSPADRPEP